MESEKDNDPFLLATSGLLAIAHKNCAAGKDRYQEAVSLAKSQRLKDQIRQRMALELGKALIKDGEKRRGRRYLAQATKYRLGLDHVSREAARILSK